MKPLKIDRVPGDGWIVLIGGGEFSFGETREIDQWILERTPDRNARVAFIPAASGSNEYGGHFGVYLRAIRPELEVVNVPVFRSRDARRGKNIGLVSGAGLIYLGGGVASMAVDALRDSPMLHAIIETLRRGSIVAGIGGGATALARLGLLHGVTVQAPFEPERDVLLRSQMSDPAVSLGIGIPPGCALAIAPDGSAEIVGEGSITAMRKAPFEEP